MPQHRNTNIVAAYLVPQRENEVLLLKRHNTGYIDGFYSLIAGHVEAGETFSQAIIREAKEEANITIKKSDIKQTHVQHRKSSTDGSERVDVYFLVEKWQGTIRNNEPQKCSGFEWYPINKLPDKIIEEVSVALQALSKSKEYSELGWD